MRLTKHALNGVRTGPLTDLKMWLVKGWGYNSSLTRDGLMWTAVEKQMEAGPGMED